MATVYKVLAQADLAATTLTDIYTVPGSTSTVCSSVIICNRGVDATFRVSLALAGAVDDVKQYIYYDTTLSANKTFIATVGVTLATTDVLRVYGSHTNITATVVGAELS